MLTGAMFAIELVVHYFVLLARLGLPAWADGIVDGGIFTLLAGPLVAWKLYGRRTDAPLPVATTIAAGSPHRRVRTAFLGALGSLAVAVVLGLLGQLSVTQQSAEYAHLINLAGRQRTLGQLVAKQAAANDASERAMLVARSEQMDRESRELHHAIDTLVARDSTGLTLAAQALARTDSLRRALLDAANRVAHSDAPAKADTRDAVQLADAMLPLMERAVSELQSVSEREKQQTVKAAIAVAIALCLLLLLIALLVVEPVVRLVRGQHQAASLRGAEVERLSLAAQRTSNAVVFTDVHRRITWVNDGFTRITGYTADEVIGKSPGAVLQSELTDRDTVLAIRRALDSGTGFHGEILNRTKNGADYWLDLDIQPTRDIAGVLTGFLAIETDITATYVERQRLASMFEAVSEGLVLLDNTGKSVRWNGAAPRILGLTPEQMSDHTLRDPLWMYLRQDGTPISMSERPSVITLRTGQSFVSVPMGVRLADGTRRWISVSSAALRNARGEIESVVVNFADVTEKTDRDQRLDLVVDGAGIGTWDLHVPSGRVLRSPRCAEMLGYAPSELSADLDAWARLLHPDDSAREKELLRAHLDGRTAEYQVEHRLRRKDGSYAWLLSAGRVTERDTDGSPVRVTGVNVDLSAQKEAEARLQRTSRQLEEAQAVARMGSWSFDLTTGTIEWSRQTYDLFGRNATDGPPDYAGMLHDYVDDDGSKLASAVTTTSTAGLPYSLILQTRFGHNGVRFIRGEGRARFDSEGVIVGMFGTATDVTAEVERETALAQARAEAEAANSKLLEINQDLELATARANDMAQQAELASQAKSEFLANMSHEIRTPLTAILGYTDILRDELTNDEAHAHGLGAVNTIRRAGVHLLSVINDILDLSKIEAGKMAIEHIETSLPRLFFDVDSLMHARAAEKGVALVTSLTTPIPERVLGDPTRIRQILMNMVGNAAKFTEQGRVEVRAMLVTHGESPVLRVEVEDTGPGMTAKQARELFQPFTQADASVTRKHGGTGLGLTICRRLATLMGGVVRLDFTAPGQGSRFVFELPLQVCEGSTMVQDLSACHDGATDSATGQWPSALPALRGRILLAEDGEDNQRLIAFHLTKAGADVTIAANGRIALDALKAEAAAGRPFDLLVTDMQMPEIDGYTLARTIRGQELTIPIIALTAHAMAEDREKCLAAGCDDYASKPIDKTHLILTCARWMHDGRHADELFPSEYGATTTPSAATSTATTSTATADDAILHSDLADDPDMAELVDQFLVALGDRVASVTHAHAAQDVASLARIAHQLKGAAGGYGFSPISEAALQVEHAAHDVLAAENTVQNARHLGELEDTVTRLLTLCRAALRGLPTHAVSRTLSEHAA